jgi:hypothetical protein
MTTDWWGLEEGSAMKSTGVGEYASNPGAEDEWCEVVSIFWMVSGSELRSKKGNRIKGGMEAAGKAHLLNDEWDADWQGCMMDRWRHSRRDSVNMSRGDSLHVSLDPEIPALALL